MMGDQRDIFAKHFFTWRLPSRADRDENLRAQPETNIVGLPGGAIAEHGLRRPLQFHHYVRCRNRQFFAGTDVERHTAPTPGLDMQTQRGKGLDLRIRRDPVNVAITTELTANDIDSSEGTNGLEKPDLFITHGFRIPADRSIHRQQYQYLEHMVLHDVANCTDLFIKTTAPLNTELLGQCDLHTRDVIAVPDGLQKSVGKPEIEKVLDGLLAEKMIDPVNGRLRKRLMQGPVQELRRGQIAAERLLHNHARVERGTRFRQPFHNDGKHARWNCQIMQRPFCFAEYLAQSLVSCLVVIVAIDVLKALGQFRESIRIQAAMFLDAIAGTRLQLIQIPARLGHADDRHVEMAAPDHRLKCGKDLLVCEVTRRAEKDKSVRMGFGHVLMIAS